MSENWTKIADIVSSIVFYLKERLSPQCDVVVILRNDSTDDQFVGGTSGETEEMIAFLQRVIKRLNSESAVEGVVVKGVSHGKGKRKPTNDRH